LIALVHLADCLGNDAAAENEREGLPTAILYHREAPSAASEAMLESLQIASAADELLIQIRVIPSIDSPERANIVALSQELNAVGVRQIPAVVFLDPDDKAYAVLEVWPDQQQNTTKLINKALDDLGKRDNAFESARQLEGIQKAQALHQGLVAVGDLWWRAYLPEAQEIIRLEREADVSELTAQYLPKLVELQLDQMIQDRVFPLIDAGKFGEASKVLESMRQTMPVTEEQSQVLLAFRVQLAMSAEKPELAKQLAQDAIELAPDNETADQLRLLVDKP
jgi:hypothetical protein